MTIEYSPNSHARPIYSLTFAAACSARHYRIFCTVSNFPRNRPHTTVTDIYWWMILTKQHCAHKTFPSVLSNCGNIRAVLSYQSDTDENKKKSSANRRIYEIPITPDFSLRVKRHKRDEYESNFIYVYTRVRPAREIVQAFLLVINGTQNLQ